MTAVTSSSHGSTVRIRSKGALLAAAAVAMLVPAAPALASGFDNMYQTANTDWDCFDGTRTNGLYCRTDNQALYIVREPGMTAKGDQDVVDVLHNEYSPTSAPGPSAPCGPVRRRRHAAHGPIRGGGRAGPR